MTGIVIGVDPGTYGAVAVILDGQLVSVDDMPIDPVLVRVNGKEHTRYKVSPSRFASLLRPFADNLDISPFKLVAEEPSYQPVVVRNTGTGQKEYKQPGRFGVASLAESIGMVRMAAACFRIPFHSIRPTTWKRVLHAPADKNLCRRRAQEVFPAWAKTFERAKDDGRAESALIAYYGWITTTQSEG